MKKTLVTSLVLLVALTAAACGFRAASTPSDTIMEVPQRVVVGGETVEGEDRGYTDQSFSAESAPMIDESITERMITRNANLTIVVTDPVESVDEISDMAQDMDGYVVSSNVYVATYGEAQVRAQSASITIRVPSDRLDEALELIKADAVEVRNDYISGQDITQEYVDNESRLRNLEAAEEQLLNIMEMATDTEDVLEVFNQLTQIRGEIEVIRGRLQYLQQSAETSSISVELIPDVETQPIEIERWQLRATFNRAVEALVATAEFFVNALIWIAIYVLPLALVIALVVWLVVRAVRKRKAKAK